MFTYYFYPQTILFSYPYHLDLSNYVFEWFKFDIISKILNSIFDFYIIVTPNRCNLCNFNQDGYKIKCFWDHMGLNMTLVLNMGMSQSWHWLLILSWRKFVRLVIFKRGIAVLIVPLQSKRYPFFIELKASPMLLLVVIFISNLGKVQPDVLVLVLNVFQNKIDLFSLAIKILGFANVPGSRWHDLVCLIFATFSLTTLPKFPGFDRALDKDLGLCP